MRLTPEQADDLGEDASLLLAIDGAFFSETHKKIGIAVSGGGDSMALLHLAKAHADLVGRELFAVTVDHGLRAEAQDEAAMVAGFCEKREIPHVTLNWDGANATGNIAAAGRDARYALIAGWAKKNQITGVLLGHTLDDVAETFLMRLARRSGVDGLSMMETLFERHGLQWARPLTSHSRQELRLYLQRRDVNWVEDPTNDDMTYERPRVRKALATLESLGITPDVLGSVAVNLMISRSALETYAQDVAEKIISFDGCDLIMDRRPEFAVPMDIDRRIKIAALRYIGGAAYAPRNGAILTMNERLSLSGSHTLAGCSINQEKKTIRFSREYNAVKDKRAQLGEIWDNRWNVVGAEAAGLTVKALGKAIIEIPDWRDVGLPRASLMSSPAVFDGETLVSAPIAGFHNGFEAKLVTDFSSFLVSR